MGKIENIEGMLPKVLSAATSNADNLKKFTAFTAKHIQYSLKNLLLFYSQCPEAEYIMPGAKGKHIIAGFVPYIEPGKAFYTLAPFSVVDVKTKNVSYNTQFFSFANAISLITGVSVWQKDKESVRYDKGNSCIYTPVNGDSKDVNELLNIYCDNFVDFTDFSDSDIKVVKAMVKFLYYNTYPPDTQEVVPSIKTLISCDNIEDIFTKALEEFRTIWEYMDYPEYEVVTE